jgi:hypothetical protein
MMKLRILEVSHDVHAPLHHARGRSRAFMELTAAPQLYPMVLAVVDVAVVP